jgi:hypothetical protein
MWSNLDLLREFGDDDTTLGQPWHFPVQPWKKADYAAKTVAPCIIERGGVKHAGMHLNTPADVRWPIVVPEGGKLLAGLGALTDAPFTLSIRVTSEGAREEVLTKWFDAPDKIEPIEVDLRHVELLQHCHDFVVGRHGLLLSGCAAWARDVEAVNQVAAVSSASPCTSANWAAMLRKVSSISRKASTTSGSK